MKKSKAYDNFQNKNFNCCESILLAYGEDAGIAKELIPKIGTGFGGGYAQKGLICGVLNAVTLMLNVKYGRTKIGDGKIEKNSQKIKDFFDAFRNEFGSIYCKGITKTNFENKDKLKSWLTSGGRNKCAKLVERSSELYEEICAKA